MVKSASAETIAEAAALLRAGKCVAFPTETVYGLGADATEARAAAQIFSIKDRPSFDPLIVHLAAADWVDDYAGDWPEAARTLASALWPGPLTIVVAKHASIPDIVTAGLPSVALRVPDHPVALELIRQCGRPVAAPSANPFGYVSPTRAEHVAAQLGERIPLILDGGPCRVGLESTIVACTGERPTLLRPGAVSLEAIEALIGPVVSSAPGAAIQAPGQIASHYAPRVALTLIAAPSAVGAGQRRDSALLSMGPVADTVGFATAIALSPTGDLEDAAANLFATLRRLDAAGLRRVFAIAPAEHGIGRAIADRLRRAAHEDSTKPSH